MFQNKKVVVVIPAYNAEKTIRQTYAEGYGSGHLTLHELLQSFLIPSFMFTKKIGSKQKTCYRAELDCEADIVIMVHSDCQYTPCFIYAMASHDTGNRVKRN